MLRLDHPLYGNNTRHRSRNKTLYTFLKQKYWHDDLGRVIGYSLRSSLASPSKPPLAVYAIPEPISLAFHKIDEGHYRWNPSTVGQAARMLGFGDAVPEHAIPELIDTVDNRNPETLRIYRNALAMLHHPHEVEAEIRDDPALAEVAGYFGRLAREGQPVTDRHIPHLASVIAEDTGLPLDEGIRALDRLSEYQLVLTHNGYMDRSGIDRTVVHPGDRFDRLFSELSH